MAKTSKRVQDIQDAEIIQPAGLDESPINTPVKENHYGKIVNSEQAEEVKKTEPVSQDPKPNDTTQATNPEPPKTTFTAEDPIPEFKFATNPNPQPNPSNPSTSGCGPQSTTPPNPSGGVPATIQSSGGGSTNVPPDIGDKAADKMAEFCMNAFCIFVPEALNKYSSIPEDHIKALVNENLVRPETLEYVKEINKNNKKALQVPSEYRKFIEGPLEETLQMQGISAPPHIRLIIAVMVVLGLMIYNASRMRSENKELIERLVELHKKSKEENQKKAA